MEYMIQPALLAPPPHQRVWVHRGLYVQGGLVCYKWSSPRPTPVGWGACLYVHACMGVCMYLYVSMYVCMYSMPRPPVCCFRDTMYPEAYMSLELHDAHEFAWPTAPIRSTAAQDLHPR